MSEASAPSPVQTAVDSAVREFRRSRRYRHRVLRAGVFAEEPGWLYVVVFYGERRRPPRRAWFAVPESGGKVQELTWTTAQRLGQIPLR